MIISEKQIMQLMNIASSHIELVSLIISKGITMNWPQEIRDQAENLLRAIANQQSEEPRVIE
jgi:hypothetical protein